MKITLHKNWRRRCRRWWRIYDSYYWTRNKNSYKRVGAKSKTLIGPVKEASDYMWVLFFPALYYALCTICAQMCSFHIDICTTAKRDMLQTTQHLAKSIYVYVPYVIKRVVQKIHYMVRVYSYISKRYIIVWTLLSVVLYMCKSTCELCYVYNKT